LAHVRSERSEAASGSVGHTDFSPDGQWGYYKMPAGGRGEPKTPLEIRVVNIDGSNDRLLYSVEASQAAYVQSFTSPGRTT